MMNKTFYVGIYLRLSRDDEETVESESISNQRDYLKDYILKRPDLEFVEEYVDDGYTGSNFNRPAFIKMIKDIEQKKINCVIVKDQSRLGRSEIVPYYVKYYFPKLRVRFIAINSNVDTFNEEASGNSLIGLNSFMDAHYCMDISKKVKSVLDYKKRQGMHLGASAIYGYQKDPNNKYKIIIDPITSKIVKKIFQLFLEGKSIRNISEILDAENIPIPSVYKHLNRKKSPHFGHWCDRTIHDILENEMYIGNMCQGKNKRLLVSSKESIRVPKENWIIVPNTHEAIIDKESFFLVQKKLNQKSHFKASKLYLLKGLLYCQECGHTLGVNFSHNKAYIMCNYYKKYSKAKVCTPHSISYFDLENIVINELKTYFKKIKKDVLLDVLLKNDKTNKKRIELTKENVKLKIEIENTTRKLEEAYMDKLNQLISSTFYLQIKNELFSQIDTYQKNIKKNELELEKLQLHQKDVYYEKIIDDFLSLKNISSFMILAFIKKIELDENLRVHIYYHFKA